MKHLKLLSALIVSILCATLGTHTARADDKQTSLETKVKAVVLFNFAKYTKWPATTFQSEQDPIKVCILGENQFGAIFSSPEAPKEAQQRPLKVIELPDKASSEEISSCNILYWHEQSDEKIAALAADLIKHSVLTVSDRPSEHAIISFTLKEEKVRFIIRRQAAAAATLELSSQLLKLAILEE